MNRSLRSVGTVSSSGALSTTIRSRSSYTTTNPRCGRAFGRGEYRRPASKRTSTRSPAANRHPVSCIGWPLNVTQSWSNSPATCERVPPASSWTRRSIRPPTCGEAASTTAWRVIQGMTGISLASFETEATFCAGERLVLMSRSEMATLDLAVVAAAGATSLCLSCLTRLPSATKAAGRSQTVCGNPSSALPGGPRHDADSSPSVPGSIPRRGFGHRCGLDDPEQRRLARAVSAADKVVLGLIGAGGRGSNLATDFAARGDVQFACIADPDANRHAALCKALAEKQGGRRRRACRTTASCWTTSRSTR